MKHLFKCLMLILALALVCPASAEPITMIGKAYISEGISFTLGEAAYRNRRLFVKGTIRAINGRDVLVPLSLSSDLDGLDSDQITSALVKEARKNGGRLLSAHCLPKSIAADDGVMKRPISTRYYDTLNPDGSVTFTFEIESDCSISAVEMNVGVVEMDNAGKARTMKFTQWTVRFTDMISD